MRSCQAPSRFASGDGFTLRWPQAAGRSVTQALVPDSPYGRPSAEVAEPSPHCHREPILLSQMESPHALRVVCRCSLRVCPWRRPSSGASSARPFGWNPTPSGLSPTSAPCRSVVGGRRGIGRQGIFSLGPEANPRGRHALTMLASGVPLAPRTPRRCGQHPAARQRGRDWAPRPGIA